MQIDNRYIETNTEGLAVCIGKLKINRQWFQLSKFLKSFQKQLKKINEGREDVLDIYVRKDEEGQRMTIQIDENSKKWDFLDERQAVHDLTELLDETIEINLDPVQFTESELEEWPTGIHEQLTLSNLLDVIIEVIPDKASIAPIIKRKPGRK